MQSSEPRLQMDEQFGRLAFRTAHALASETQSARASRVCMTTSPHLTLRIKKVFHFLRGTDCPCKLRRLNNNDDIFDRYICVQIRA